MNNITAFLFILTLFCLPGQEVSAQDTTVKPIRITSMSRGQIIALYKDCRNDLHVQWNGFEDYRHLRYTVEGGELIADVARPYVVSICPRKPSVKLTVSYHDSVLTEVQYKVRTVPRPKLYIQQQGRLLPLGTVLNKSLINSYTLVLSSLGDFFYVECKADANWEAEYQLQFKRKEEIVLDYVSKTGQLNDIPLELLKKCDRVSVVPVQCFRINFKGEKFPYELGRMPYEIDLH